MKKFYCVVSFIYDNGSARTKIIEVLAYVKPESEYKSGEIFDLYKDYFRTLKEAKEFEQGYYE